MYRPISSPILQFVIAEIESILEEYPQHPYQVAFSMQELRKKLIAQVLNNLPNRYRVIKETKDSNNPLKPIKHSLEDRVRLETLIRGSIYHVLRENADWISHNLPQKESINNPQKTGTISYSSFQVNEVHNRV
jgi:hypothetical protein